MENSEDEHFQDPHGDVYFRTSDDTVFCVGTRFLSFASEAFEGMFAIHRHCRPNLIVDNTRLMSPERNANGAPSASTLAEPSPTEGSISRPITIDADARTLSAVLRFIYPVSKPWLEYDVPLLGLCLAFADKYITTSLGDTFRSYLVNPHVLKTEPMRAYCLACRFGTSEQRIITRRATLKYNIINIEPQNEMRLISGMEYFDLISSHSKRKEAALKLISTLPDAVEGKVWWHTGQCACNALQSNDGWLVGRRPPLWVEAYMKHASKALSEDFQLDTIEEVIGEKTRLECAKMTDCAGCVGNVLVHWKRMERFREDLRALYLSSTL